VRLFLSVDRFGFPGAAATVKPFSSAPGPARLRGSFATDAGGGPPFRRHSGNLETMVRSNRLVSIQGLSASWFHSVSCGGLIAAYSLLLQKYLRLFPQHF
jgi:hypothetical protein